MFGKNKYKASFPGQRLNFSDFYIPYFSIVCISNQGSKAHTSLANKVHAHEARINNKFEDQMRLRLIKRSVRENLPTDVSLYTDKVSYESRCMQ